MNEELEKIKKGIVELESDEISAYVKEALDAKNTPLSIVNAMSAGMVVVGEKFEKSEYYLPDLIMAGETMKEGLKIVEPLLAGAKKESLGTVVLATVKDDIHEIGKTLVGTMLTSAGFEVIDLGVDVSEEKIVEAARGNGADIVGLSALLTMTVNNIKNVNDALERDGLRKKINVMAGGACVTEEIAKELGCDAFGKDAVQAVEICKQLMGKK